MLVEDDEKLRKELEKFLQSNGYEVIGLSNFEQVVEDVLSQNPDLLLLDINLPNTDGEYVCKELRKTSELPIIMITSRNTEMDELICMNYGADDFVTKPFHTQILLARIYSILKRVHKVNENQNRIVCEAFVINVSKSMIEKEEKSIELTKNELKILHYLAFRRNTIVSRDAIITYLWDSQMFVDDNTLTVNMNRLRKKLEEIGVNDAIETRRGQGYLLK